MRIVVNGNWREVSARDLAAALEELGLSERTVATALNGEFVPGASRSSCALCEGDRIEVLVPMQGG